MTVTLSETTSCRSSVLASLCDPAKLWKHALRGALTAGTESGSAGIFFARIRLCSKSIELLIKYCCRLRCILWEDCFVRSNSGGLWGRDAENKSADIPCVRYIRLHVPSTGTALYIFWVWSFFLLLERFNSSCKKARSVVCPLSSQ